VSMAAVAPCRRPWRSGTPARSGGYNAIASNQKRLEHLRLMATRKCKIEREKELRVGLATVSPSRRRSGEQCGGDDALSCLIRARMTVLVGGAYRARRGRAVGGVDWVVAQ
jgi:hypothetical protein